MDLATIASLTGTNPRRLRYVVDHAVVAGAAGVAPGRGAPRDFTHGTAFAIAVAARLLDAGMRRRFVRGVLRNMLEDEKKVSSWGRLMRTPPTEGREWFWEFADGEAMRMCVSDSIIERGYCPRWVRIEDDVKLPADHRPITVIKVDLEELRRRLWQG